MSDPERRPRLTERYHELAMSAATRRPVDARPSFGVNRVKGVGGQLLIEWDVSVPVCDEYPTARAAWQATLTFAEGYESAFPAPPTTNGGEK